VVNPTSKRCREGLHLWCGALAGRMGQWPCGCSCHDHGRPHTANADRVVA